MVELGVRVHRRIRACVEVGELAEKNKGIKLIENGTARDVVYVEEDPYWTAFFTAFNSGWK